MMPAWILWLGATLLPLGALWALWQLVLRHEHGYGYNRALLLLAPLLAAGLPLLPRPVLPALPAWLAGSGAVTAPVAGPLLVTISPAGPAVAAAEWPGWPWLLGLYVVGVAVGLGRLAWQAGRLRWLAGRLPRFEHAGYTLVHTGGQLPTSAFGQVVFWDETAALTAAEAQAVLAHELAHVRQHHTRDVLWLRLWQVVLWPNPIAHLLLPALRLTHELLADREATAQATPAAYAPVLAGLAARQFTSAVPAALLHPFTFSFTLTRLAMLKNPTPVRRWKQWLPLPVLAAVGCLIGRPTAAQTTPAPPAPVAATGPVSITSPPFRRGDQVAYKRAWREMRREDSLKNPGVNTSNYIMSFTQDPVPGQPGMVHGTLTYVPNSQWVFGQGTTADGNPAQVYTYVEQMPQLPSGGGNRAIVEAIQKNIVYPTNGNTQGKVFVKFIVQADGSVTGVEIAKSLADAYDQAVLDAVKRLPRFVPGRQHNKPVAVSFTVPVLFAAKP